MAKKINLSTKQLQINKANTQVVAITAMAAAVVVFSLVSGRALLIKRAYQSRIIKEKEIALKQLKSNSNNVNKLVDAYTKFQEADTNVIGGLAKGSGDRDGDNAKIILDALPSQYDFPALTASLEKILSDPNYKINSITGTDDEIAQAKNASSASPAPVEIPFEIAVGGNYNSIQRLVTTLEKSIRPFQVRTIDMSGKDSSIQTVITAKTYYQPEKNLNVRTKEIK